MPLKTPDRRPAEPRRETFRVTVEIRGTLLYKALRNVIETAINSFPNVRFVSIAEEHIPDRFELSDPDKLPLDWM